MKRCWPIWCVVCWKTAPIPRSLTVSLITTLPLDELVADPVMRGRKTGASRKARPACRIRKFHYRAISTARSRSNSAGLDLANEHRLASLSSSLLNSALHKWHGATDAGACRWPTGEMQPVINPAEPKDIVGYVREASDARSAAGADQR